MLKKEASALTEDRNEVLAQEIKNLITSYVEKNHQNYCQHFKDRFFDSPLIGFARGDEPIFETIQEQVGIESMTPQQALLNAVHAKDAAFGIKPEEVSVISWVLPISSTVRDKNRLQKAGPADEWCYTRNDGEQFNMELRRQVVKWLEGRGYLATAPFLLPEFRIIRDPARRNFTSTWSERHIAYTCGLGTFSLNDALITPRGIAHRLGSVVVNAKLPTTPLPYSGHMDYCLFSKGCVACIKRCPAGAISKEGHNKDLCQQMTSIGKEAAARRERLGLEKTGCGLCQVGVPCEDRIPVKSIKF